MSQVRGRACGGNVRGGRFTGEEGDEGGEGMANNVAQEKLASED